MASPVVTLFSGEMHKSAMLSDCGKYRYSLSRIWDNKGPLLAWVCLNPSIADAERDDPTLKQMMHFSQAWGYGGLYVTNLFAYRTTYPKDLTKLSREVAVGPLNNEHIGHVLAMTQAVIGGWGASGTRWGRDKEVLSLIKASGRTLLAFETSDARFPLHPLYKKHTLTAKPWVGIT